MKSVHEKVELIGPTNFYIMSLSKYLILLYRGETVKKCFKHIEEDWKFCSIHENYRQIMLKNAHYGRYLIILCAIFMYCGGFGYHLVRPLVSEKIITHENITVIPYPAPVYGKFLNTGYSPYYEIIFILLLVADFVLFSATVVPFSFASVLTLHACGQLEIATIYLNDLVSETRKETNFAHERLIIIINSHLRVLSFVSQLEQLLNEICLIEVVGCSMNMCLVGSYIIESWKKDDLTATISYAVILLSFTFNIFIYCYLGELLTTQATKLGEKGYMIEWHRLPRKISLDLLLFIRVCQFPAKITAGKVVTLSMATFSKVYLLDCR
ncbi:uncharacterized protein LOC122512468 [Leptopilina heterotoma]|uniref:uncharacterized protein LOC122512468 n=1 Tax=Leptopilina heterotoma TaxID=63436 RepID=UPI001CA9ADFB|nr:uncharacterized protein LOC122512468 [Leptopilina heterotoma]